LSKHPLARRTLKWLNILVYNFGVPVQIGVATKTLLTMVALKWLNFIVYRSDVCLQAIDADITAIA
jgi:hypothetical protein